MDEKGKVARFVFREGNEKRCLHLIELKWVWEKHSEGSEEELWVEEGMRKCIEAILQKPSKILEAEEIIWFSERRMSSTMDKAILCFKRVLIPSLF